MLLYLYTLDYDEDISGLDPQEIKDGSENVPTAKAIDYEQILDHVRVYTLADKLDIGGLKSLAKSKFQAAVSGHWPLPRFPEIVREIFTSTPSTDDGLRNIATAICAEHIEDLLNEGTISDTHEHFMEDLFQTQDQITWKNMIDELGDFSTALMTQIVKNRKADEFKTIKDLLRNKLGPAGIEFSTLLDLASQVPRCCGAANFQLHAVRGNQHRLRLKCTVCHNVYRGF